MNIEMEKISLANLPTKIERLDYTSNKFKRNIFIKRDDFTGIELSGNKVRKLEYALAEALSQGADTIITCGGIQSNHARATAAAATKLGLKSILILSSDEELPPNGNYLLDMLLGAEVRFISSEDYSHNLKAILNEVAENLKNEGRKGYIIPTGASNGIGTFGYFNALKEIVEQEKQLGLEFDTICCTVGSGGTYAGLCLGNKILNLNRQIIGFNISSTKEYFIDEVIKISKEFYSYLEGNNTLEEADIKIIDGNVGLGYALSTPEELKFLNDFAKNEGIILDPVYTAKAMKGLYSELGNPKTNYLNNSKNILFIHTGGLFGLFPKSLEFEFN
ncbi:D-cysteine desulfhydrase family protein [Anaerosphaera multitolerans]|uniref:D-cysteine desulfhydrase family protein n=1 Tax=Anaerosphaera multitolerans TaxID=2487351 RepID=A0A437S4F0_9FIRM|nr:D-cysteine desulfhydrase family protein [Anaerosphaera multitolerans]RVU53889.1 D-cysteine desulfhydrase family protein [Anaerosphaera multitolerans]